MSGNKNVLVLNSGSSSLKSSVFVTGDTRSEEPVCTFEAELTGIGSAHPTLEVSDEACKPAGKTQSEVSAQTTQDALGLVFDRLRASELQVDALGYRVVHPGATIHDHQRLTPEIVKDLEQAAVFAPLHDPEVLAIIRTGLDKFRDVPHFACFDTVFHQTMPPEASTYAIPETYRNQGVHRYGFHGLVCESVVRQLRQSEHGLPHRVIVAHLGSGCSVTAVVKGRSVDTTMGLTPTGGVVMGTRPGDLDPGLVLYMLRQEQGDAGVAVATVEKALNHASGLVALSGLQNDVKAVRAAAEAGDGKASLALKVFTRSVTKVIGGFTWLMGGVDAIVFSGGIGEHDAATRGEILAGLEEQGIRIDAALNKTMENGIHSISEPNARTAVFVVPAQEDLMIAIHVGRMMRVQ